MDYGFKQQFSCGIFSNVGQFCTSGDTAEVVLPIVKLEHLCEVLDKHMISVVGFKKM